jgi:hypothetical protein
MKSYILLRDNQEAGHFTLKELKAFGLISTDLIWVEDESTSWQHPTEIKELKGIAKRGVKSSLPSKSLKSSETTSSLKNKEDSSNINRPYDLTGDIDIKPALSERERNYLYNLEQQEKKNTKVTANLFGLTVLLIGVALCVFVAIKMFDSFAYDFSPTAEAKEIKEEVLPTSSSAHNALSLNEEKKTQMENVGLIPEKKDSIHVKGIAVKKSLSRSEIKDKEALAISDSAIALANKNDSILAAEIKAAKSKAEEAEVKTTVDRTPVIQISANDYKVGLFGGISDLELSLTNPSSLTVQKAIVEVEYLKPNGSVIKSQNFDVENISPGSSKKLVVPSNKRGVKVRYRVVSVDTAVVNRG